MSQVSSEAEGQDRVRLEEVILYLFGKESQRREGESFKVPIAKLHRVIETVEDDLEELGIKLRFHESVGHVHSQQVEEAIDKIIPYIIPVSNPSYSLDVYERVGENAREQSEVSLSDEQMERLDEIFEKEDFRKVFEQNLRIYEGG